MKNSYKSLFLLSFIFSVGTQSSSASQLNRAFLDFCDQNSKMETISQLRKISSCRDCHCLQDYLGSKKEVDFSNQNLGDIKFLRFFRHFLKIDLSDNRITDISPLANMRLLEQLWLDDNEIRQIQSLKFLKNLLLFSASYNHIENISAVSQCKKLQAINLSQNQIQNLTPLKQLDNLRFIYLSHNKIEDITPISFLPGYRDLKTLNSQVLYHHSINWQVYLKEDFFNWNYFYDIDLEHNPISQTTLDRGVARRNTGCPQNSSFSKIRKLCRNQF